MIKNQIKVLHKLFIYVTLLYFNMYLIKFKKITLILFIDDSY